MHQDVYTCTNRAVTSRNMSRAATYMCLLVSVGQHGEMSQNNNMSPNVTRHDILCRELHDLGDIRDMRHVPLNNIGT